VKTVSGKPEERSKVQEAAENLVQSFRNLKDRLLAKRFNTGLERVPDLERMDLELLQKNVEDWAITNFDRNQSKVNGMPLDSTAPLWGLVEEVGELSGITIKYHQGRRGYDPNTQEGRLKFRNDQYDAVGDIMIFLLDYCSRESINLLDAVNYTWSQIVSKRTVQTWEQHTHENVGKEVPQEQPKEETQPPKCVGGRCPPKKDSKRPKPPEETKPDSEEDQELPEPLKTLLETLVEAFSTPVEDSEREPVSEELQKEAERIGLCGGATGVKVDFRSESGGAEARKFFGASLTRNVLSTVTLVCLEKHGWKLSDLGGMVFLTPKEFTPTKKFLEFFAQQTWRQFEIDVKDFQLTACFPSGLVEILKSAGIMKVLEARTKEEADRVITQMMRDFKGSPKDFPIVLAELRDPEEKPAVDPMPSIWNDKIVTSAVSTMRVM